MQIVVISPEHADPRETAVLGGLLAAGLERYHVRKPHWPIEKVAAWLRSLPEAWRPSLVLHSHRDLAIELGLGGYHWSRGSAPLRPLNAGYDAVDFPRLTAAENQDVRGHLSRSCHTLDELRFSLGRFDLVFFGPLFPSISKPGYGPGQEFPREALAELLGAGGTAEQRRTAVFALGGVTAGRVSHCRELGFDGVAVVGAVWHAEDPVAAFRELKVAERLVPNAFSPIMCLTQDGLPISHVEQAERLCAAGARWIQLRMKNAVSAAWLLTAREVVGRCHAHGAVCIVNDSADIALAAGADGVHVGQRDLEWREARRRIGPRAILGGTVNDEAEADRALAVGCLDYVGVGPLRFTTTKQNLAPVLGLDGVRALVDRLDGLPVWVIGGIEADDLPALRSAGAAGAAVASALYRGGRIEENLSALQAAWNSQPAHALLS